MDPNFTSNHRGSMQDFSNDFSNSTLYGGSNGRSSSTGQLQYQHMSYQSQYSPELSQQRMPNQFEHSQAEVWRNDFDFPQPRGSGANGLDIEGIQEISRSVNEAPWSSAVVRSGSGYRLPPVPQEWSPAVYAPRPHTVAEGPVTPQFQRPPLDDSRLSLSLSQDSGFVSGRHTDVHTSRGDENEIYVFQAGDRSLFNNNLSSAPPTSVKSDSGLPTNEETIRRRRSKAQVSSCTKCDKTFNNRSDAHKHALQHTKPHKCEVVTCSRNQDGFATKNDLQRHRKSVHKAQPSVGQQNGYICQGCLAASPGTTPKWWPRLDNFKAHITRKHGELDLARLVKMSEAPRPPDHPMSESGYASQYQPSLAPGEYEDHNDLTSPLELSMSRDASHQGDMTLFGLDSGHFESLAGVGEALADSFPGNRESYSRFRGSTSGSVINELSVSHDAKFGLAVPMNSSLSSPVSHIDSVPTVHSNESGFSKQQPAFSHVQWSGSRLDHSKIHLDAKPYCVLDGQDRLACNRNDSGEWICPYPYCSKPKKRECDLRKHIKRHTRPYGCTFPNCYSRFGSRNDWKRHENSQHTPKKMWRCEIEGVSGSKCGRVVYEGNAFVHHLQYKHGLDGKSPEVREHQKNMYLGREGYHRFWCGFCNGLTDQEDSGKQDDVQQNAWFMRFKHIGDHFDKQGLYIDDWVCIEHNKKKRLITKEEQNQANTRGRNDQPGDESDLPEDGILYPSCQGASLQPCHSHDTGRSSGGDTYTPVKPNLEDDDMDADGVSDSGE